MTCVGICVLEWWIRWINWVSHLYDVLLFNSAVHSDAGAVHSDVYPVHSDAGAVHSDVDPVHSDADMVHFEVGAVHSDVAALLLAAQAVHPQVVHPYAVLAHTGAPLVQHLSICEDEPSGLVIV